MANQPIGVFDSGLGGLTAVKELLNVLPNEDITYFGDTSRVPYGTRSKETIVKYAMQDINFLLKNNVKMVIAACGTVSSVAVDVGKIVNVPFTGVVKPTCLSAVKATKNGKIGVIGTSATIRSKSYHREIQRIDEKIEVIEQDCPLFVPLVESGFIERNDEIVKLTVSRYLKELKDRQVDTLILGCTHYPILKEAIKDFMGTNVTLVDSGRETALFAADLLANNGLLNESKEAGTCKFFVSDRPDGFASVADIFLNDKISHNVEQIDIEKY
ncbi:MAG: glutamate racemase [Bacillota bacterium]|nr:glutamate racemase [Bacillota bacterium]